MEYTSKSGGDGCTCTCKCGLNAEAGQGWTQDKNGSKDEQNGEEEKSSWKEFTENTTMHGLRYVHIPGSPVLARFVLNSEQCTMMTAD